MVDLARVCQKSSFKGKTLRQHLSLLRGWLQLATPSTAHSEHVVSDRFRGHLALLIFACLVSGSFSLGGVAAPYLEPTAFMAVRFLLASAGLVSVIMVAVRVKGGNRSGNTGNADEYQDQLPRGMGLVLDVLRRKNWQILLLGVLYGSYFIGMFAALRVSDPAPVSAVFTLTPLMTAGLVFLFFRQKTELPVLAALLIGGIGAVWVIFDGNWADIIRFRMGEGELIFLAGVFAHAVYSSLTKPLQGSAPLLPFVLGIVLSAFAFLLIVGFDDIRATAWLDLPLFVWATVLYLAYGATMLTISLLQYAAVRLPAPKVMAYTYLVPAIVILIEGLSGRGWAPLEVLPGVVAILAALVLLAARRDHV